MMITYPSIHSTISMIIGIGLTLYFWKINKKENDAQFDEYNLSIAFFALGVIFGVVFGSYMLYTHQGDNKSMISFVKDFYPNLINSALLVVGYLIGNYIKTGSKHEDSKKEYKYIRRRTGVK